MKNLVIVTSVVSPTSDPLSYSATRSVYTAEQRLQQTKETIASVRSKIPNSCIVLVECSPPETVDQLSLLVDRFINLYPNDSIRCTPHKSQGEARMLSVGLKEIENFNPDLIFKLSGRYFLTDSFDWVSWKTNTINASFTENYGGKSVHTFCYSFSRSMADQIAGFLTRMIETPDPTCVEIQFFRHFEKAIQFHGGPMHVLARWSSYSHTSTL